MIAWLQNHLHSLPRSAGNTKQRRCGLYAARIFLRNTDNGIKAILPTGGTGTFKIYYQKDSGYIYAKTGSLSNHIAISGFLFTKKGKWIIFSILTNQFQGSATQVRRAEEKFLEGIREKY